MSLPDDLLEVARQLARLDPTRPKQAALRRAVSTAYYALFHLLTSEAAGLYVSTDTLGGSIGRAIDHSEMKKVSQEFAAGRLPRGLAAHGATVFVGPTGDQVKWLAQTFVSLQEERHEADYNPSRRFYRQEVVQLVAQAERAFASWADIRRSDQARLYLGCLLLWERWNKPPR